MATYLIVDIKVTNREKSEGIESNVILITSWCTELPLPNESVLRKMKGDRTETLLCKE